MPRSAYDEFWPPNFTLIIGEVVYHVQQSVADKNIYQLNCQNGFYLIAKDFFGVWAQLASKPGSPDISLKKIGGLIEEYHKAAN
jgi:hypothetical protein